jgi:ADP-ribose pyrophosphatase
VEGELLEVVAGKRDVPGEPPEVTARRELEEELGMRAGRVVKLGEFYNSPGFCDEYSYVYCALDLEPLRELHPVTAEEAAMTTETIAFADLDRLVAEGSIVDAKSIIGLYLTRQFLAAEAVPSPPRTPG